MNWATRILGLAALALAGLTFPAAAQQQQWSLNVPFSPLPFGVPPPFGAITGSFIVDGPTRRITSWNFTTTPGNGLCTVGLNVSSCGFAGMQYSPANTHLAFDSDTHLLPNFSLVYLVLGQTPGDRPAPGLIFGFRATPDPSRMDIYVLSERSSTGYRALDVLSQNAYLIVTPVPEPSSYATMLAGLALLAWAMRRRAESHVRSPASRRPNPATGSRTPVNDPRCS
jgi:hypothetical protein